MDHEKKAPDPSDEDEKVVPPVSAQRRESRLSDASASISESVAHGKDTVAAVASGALDSGLQSIGAAKDTAADLASQAGSAAAGLASQAGSATARSARNFASNVAGQVSDAAGDIADRGAAATSAATAQAKSFAAELEAMARRNPLVAIAGAVAIGALIGLLGRRR
jgi:ElaB/YqjD/DUF883 family membrane-anchored ribosome-binding protein